LPLPAGETGERSSPGEGSGGNHSSSSRGAKRRGDLIRHRKRPGIASRPVPVWSRGQDFLRPSAGGFAGGGNPSKSSRIRACEADPRVAVSPKGKLPAVRPKISSRFDARKKAGISRPSPDWLRGQDDSHPRCSDFGEGTASKSSEIRSSARRQRIALRAIRTCFSVQIRLREKKGRVERLGRIEFGCGGKIGRTFGAPIALRAIRTCFSSNCRSEKRKGRVRRPGRNTFGCGGKI
jgi:hypothetical protein